MTTLTSKQILDLIRPTRGVGAGKGAAGAAMALKRHLDSGRGPSFGTTDQRRFLEAFITRDEPVKPGSSQVRRQPVKTPYSHPERAARFVPQGAGASGTDGRTGLEPADIVWMQRLPTDPAQVTYADAVQLASLMQLTKPNTADRRLAESIWRPVKHVHDLKAAEVELENARRPLPDVPSTALGALAEAVRAEVPQLTDDEVVGRASNMLREALDGRTAERDQRIAAAEAQVEAVKAEQASREALSA